MCVPSRYAGLMAYIPQDPEMQKTSRYSKGSKLQLAGPGVCCRMCVYARVLSSDCQLPETCLHLQLYRLGCSA